MRSRKICLPGVHSLKVVEGAATLKSARSNARQASPQRGAPKGNKNAAKGDTERLPWRLPVEWGIRDAIEKAAKAKKLKPAEVLKAHFGVQNVQAEARRQ